MKGVVGEVKVVKERKVGKVNREFSRKSKSWKAKR